MNGLCPKLREASVPTAIGREVVCPLRPPPVVRFTPVVVPRRAGYLLHVPLTRQDGFPGNRAATRLEPIQAWRWQSRA